MAFQTAVHMAFGSLVLLHFILIGAASTGGVGNMLAQIIRDRHGFSEKIKRPCHVVTVNLSSGIIQELASWKPTTRINPAFFSIHIYLDACICFVRILPFLVAYVQVALRTNVIVRQYSYVKVQEKVGLRDSGCF